MYYVCMWVVNWCEDGTLTGVNLVSGEGGGYTEYYTTAQPTRKKMGDTVPPTPTPSNPWLPSILVHPDRDTFFIRYKT